MVLHRGLAAPGIVDGGGAGRLEHALVACKRCGCLVIAYALALGEASIYV
jgi:hypothetical protein